MEKASVQEQLSLNGSPLGLSARCLRMGRTYRYSRPYSCESSVIDGYPNYFYHTLVPNHTKSLLESGINPIGKVVGPDGPRVPAILISSSPHKVGQIETPWQDFFDPDNGHIKYFGDNKTPDDDPSCSSGNRALLDAFNFHSSPKSSNRAKAVPILFFQRVPILNKQKGYVKFHGFGLVTNIARVVQYGTSKEETFANYAFDFAVLSLAGENEYFDWRWINDLRNPQLTVQETARFAPESWKDWVKYGATHLERNRRRVSKLLVVQGADQLPLKDSPEAKILDDVYEYYRKEGKQRRFEYLALRVAARVISTSLSAFHLGWVTPPSADGGADFIGRLDIGQGDFGKAKIIVLGQAKCEKPGNPTGGKDVARTVARLKRGWLGVYVTTSFFSGPVQQEIIEDAYPLVLVNGRKLAGEVRSMAHEQGQATNDFLKEIDSQYESCVKKRRPEEVLSDPVDGC